MPRAHPVVLVTGTSTGIGREAVHHLRAAGCRVVATARNPAAIADLAVAGEVEVMELDVTSDAERRACVSEVLERHGQLDVLVNNAGYGARLAAEDTSGEVLRGMFETNLFGAHELALLALPGMRERGSGRIVNVASIAGHVSVPLMGAYCATKFALRALTQALHNEVRPLGIHACLVEPGVIKTQFGARSLRETHEASRGVPLESGPYGAMYRKWESMTVARGGRHPRVVARAIVHAATARRPRFHYFTPIDSKVYNLLKRALPDAWLNWGYGQYFR